MSSLRSSNLGIGDFVLRHRLPIGAVLIGITIIMGWFAAHVKAATRFENLFPADHQNVKLYEQYQDSYGGAQTLVLMMRVKHGDVFNYQTLKKIIDLQNDMNKLPAVDHNEIFSLASYRLAYTTALPGALVSKCFMYPKMPANQNQLDELRHNVDAHRDQVRGLITYDNKGALLTATFNAYDIDYGKLFTQIQALVHRYQDANTNVYVAGLPVVVGWGYYYFNEIALIFLCSVGLMLIILYLSLGQRSSWWAPILTGSFSAVWGLGFVGLMGYNFDPTMMVIPFILTARDLSHGIQWQGRYYDELDRLDDKHAACATTTDVMLPPGFLSIIADIAGIIFISLGGIPVLKQIGFAGAVWLAGSLTMVFVFQPIFMSYLPRPRIKARKAGSGAVMRRLRAAGDRVARIPVTPGVVRGAILAFGAGFIVWGVANGLRAKIGYETAGTPLYRPNSKVNRDMAEIGKFFPLDEGWIVLETPDWPSDQSTLGPPVLRMTDDMHDYLLSRGQVLAVVSFSTSIVKPFNRLFHNGYPKFLSAPDTAKLGGNLWWLFFGGTAPGEMERFFANNPKVTSTCIRVLLPDHTYTRLKTLTAQISDFVKLRVASDPSLKGVTVRYLGGEAGLYAAANDVLYRLDLINITFVLAAIFVFCAVSFRSAVAGALFIVSCVMANFGAFVYMRWRGIGLTVDTIPVISLGIGLGVDYGIYTVARIRDEVMGGRKIDEAITTALHTTGGAVFSTFAVMVGGILPWAFSPLLFHNEMSVLLIFLMGTNMIAGVLILPCYIAWRRPWFIRKYEGARETPPGMVAGSLAG